MQVMQGWSGEVQPNRWAKVDVTLSEVDLSRILAGAGIELPADRLPLSLAWQLLEAEAERFVLAKLIRSHGYPGEQGKARLLELAQTNRDLLAKVRALTDG